MGNIIVTERPHANRMARLQASPEWLTALGYIAGYVFLNWLSDAVSSAPFGIVPWSPETGLTFAALLMFGNGFWPYAIGAIAVANVLLHWHELPWLCHLLAPVIVGGGYALAVVITQRSKWRIDLRLETLRDVLVLETAAAVSCGAVASAYVLLLAASGEPTNISSDIFRLAIGDLIGISIITPCILMLANAGRIRRPTWESLLQGSSIIAALVLAFGFSSLPHFRLFNIIFFPIIWIALRHGLEGATYGLVITQLGLMAALYLSGPQSAGITSYQALMLVLAFTGLAIGGLVTERRQFEQRQRLAQDSVAKIFQLGSAGELATTIAHEINQPLTAISNYVRLVQRHLQTGEGDKATAEEAISKMANQVDRTAAVVKNLRDLIRLGRRQIKQQSVHVLIREALDLLEPNLQRAGISVKVAIARDIREAPVDRLQIEQVLINIISNAIDAIDGSGTHPRMINIAAYNLDDERVEIVVRDSGPGFPDGFDFSHSGIRSSNKKDSLGVGLSLSRTLVEGHDGELLLENDGAGAVVRIRLKTLPKDCRQ